MSEAEFGAVVERVMADEGFVCSPDHEGIPQPGECINCDAERHQFGYRLYAALHGADQTAALELVRLREGIRRLASRMGAIADLSPRSHLRYAEVARELRALLDDNEGERS